MSNTRDKQKRNKTRRSGAGRQEAARGRRPAKRESARQDSARREAVRREPRAVFEEAVQESANHIIGRNPVTEALTSGREIDKIIALKNGEGSVKKILGEAKDRGIPIRYADRIELDRISGGGRHQGIIAFVAEYDYHTVEDMLQLAAERDEDPFLIILDNVEDPHNLGAVMRTAECVGAHGVIIGKNRSAGLTEVVAKTSAGAIEYLPVAKVTNIARTVEDLKKKNIWVAACDMDGDTCFEAGLTGPIAIVIGNEGKGISRLVKESCDFTVSIPMRGNVSSLNASNAAAVLMYEVRRQRDGVAK